jgi:hypothetical protein
VIDFELDDDDDLKEGDSGAAMIDYRGKEPILHSFYKGKFTFTDPKPSNFMVRFFNSLFKGRSETNDETSNKKTSNKKTYYVLSPANLVLKQIERLLRNKCFFCSLENIYDSNNEKMVIDSSIIINNNDMSTNDHENNNDG